MFQPIKNRYTTPLKAVAPEPKPYISPNFVKSAESPFYMANENDMKRFMSGRLFIDLILNNYLYEQIRPLLFVLLILYILKVSEYDQELP